MSMKSFNSKKDHISGKYKYVKNVEFIQLYEDGEVDFDGNKLTYKDGCWRLGMVQREIWDNGGWGARELKTVLIPIKYKSEGLSLKQIYKLFILTSIKN